MHSPKYLVGREHISIGLVMIASWDVFDHNMPVVEVSSKETSLT